MQKRKTMAFSCWPLSTCRYYSYTFHIRYFSNNMPKVVQMVRSPLIEYLRSTVLLLSVMHAAQSTANSFEKLRFSKLMQRDTKLIQGKTHHFIIKWQLIFQAMVELRYFQNLPLLARCCSTSRLILI